MKVKILLKILPLLIVVAIVSLTPYFMQRMGGFGNSGDYSAPEPVISSEETRQTYYKWKDENGRWHMGDEVPEGAEVTAVEIDTAANIIQSIKTPAKAAEEKEEVEQPSAVMPGIPMTVNPKDVGKLIDDAKNIQTLLDERNQRMENAQ